MPTKRTSPAESPAKTNQPEIPGWVDETPSDHTYQLVMFENNDAAIEEVDVSRDEYIALKNHLAAMRGYTPIDPTDALGMKTRLAELAEDFRFSEGATMPHATDEIAMHVMTARDIYRCDPELVTVCDEGIQELLLAMLDEEAWESDPRLIAIADADVGASTRGTNG